MSNSRAEVIAAVERCFHGSASAEALAVLDHYGLEPHEGERERVQLAMVALSNGDKLKLSQLVKFAKTDYRDILSWHATGPLTPEAGEKALQAVRDVLKKFGQP